MTSNYFEADFLLFENNNCKLCNGTCLNIKDSNFSISNSNFTNNTGFYGGAIAISDCYIETD